MVAFLLLANNDIATTQQLESIVGAKIKYRGKDVCVRVCVLCRHHIDDNDAQRNKVCFVFDTMENT